MRESPKNDQSWLEEVALAYRDAEETLLLDPSIGHDGLFHLAPVVCLKFREIRRTKSALKKATGAALTSYTATQDQDDETLRVPQMAFAFCYVASHFGLGLLDEQRSSEILGYLEENLHNLVTKTA